MENQKWSEKAATGLRNAADELEQFALKYNLGKMEAASFYRNAKKRYRVYLNSISTRIHQTRTISKAAKDKLIESLNRLKKKMIEQRDSATLVFLLSGFRKLRQQFSKNRIPKEVLDDLDSEIHKLQIRIKILNLKMEEKKIVAGQQFKNRKSLIKQRMEKFRSRLHQIAGTKTKSSVQQELTKNWSRLKAVFS
jgi:hypothetical protein